MVASYTQGELTKEAHIINAFIPKGSELKIEGVTVSIGDSHQKHDTSLKTKFTPNSTIIDVVEVLGPGFINSKDGTGAIWWYFQDGSAITTEFFPKNLNNKISLRYKYD